MKFLRKLAIITLILAIIGGSLYYIEYYRPRILFNEAATSDIPLSVAEQRELCHDCIQWGTHHDSYLRLCYVGDNSSIPYLIKSLKRLEDTDSCIKSHCIEALETISGQKFGNDYTAWQNWNSTN